MATGTGKTRTALKILEYLVSNRVIDSVIVATDGTDLMSQWVRQLNTIASSLVPKYRVLRHFGRFHESESYELSPPNAILVISRQSLSAVLHSIGKTQLSSLLLIHDEVHGFGSPANRKELPGLSDNISYRLGLSATPEREYDQAGTAFIAEHIGPVVYRFSLEDAIRRGVLCEFDYHPLPYDMTEEDRVRIRAVYSQKSAREAEGNPMSDAELWTALARVYKTSEGKLPVFASFIEAHPQVFERSIIFVEERGYGEKIIQLLHQHRYDYHTYYADDEGAQLGCFCSRRTRMLDHLPSTVAGN